MRLTDSAVLLVIVFVLSGEQCCFGAADGVPIAVGSSGSYSADDFLYHGAYLAPGAPEADRIRGFSIGVAICNIGDTGLEWTASHNGALGGHHPVTTANIFRLSDGRFEQVGMSWCFHQYCGTNESSCGACEPTSCSTLGVNCTSSQSASFLGGQNALGPRSEINPWPDAGDPTHESLSAAADSASSTFVDGLLQMTDGVIDTTNGANGRFFVDVHYVVGDEPAANRFNNASWREVDVDMTTISGTRAPQDVHAGEPAIYAWSAADPSVTVSIVDVPQDGRIFVGSRVHALGDGTYEYQYAVYNLNSHRGAGAFSVPATGAITDASFHDVHYHGADGIGGVTQDATDWVLALDGSSIRWSTADHAANPNANALRWGTMYTFTFRSTAAPVTGTVTIGLFRPGADASVAVVTDVPGIAPCDADTNGSGIVDVDDLVNVILDWSTDGSANGGDVNGSGMVNVDDLIEVILDWGPC